MYDPNLLSKGTYDLCSMCTPSSGRPSSLPRAGRTAGLASPGLGNWKLIPKNSYDVERWPKKTFCNIVSNGDMLLHLNWKVARFPHDYVIGHSISLDLYFTTFVAPNQLTSANYKSKLWISKAKNSCCFCPVEREHCVVWPDCTAVWLPHDGSTEPAAQDRKAEKEK